MEKEIDKIKDILEKFIEKYHLIIIRIICLQVYQNMITCM